MHIPVLLDDTVNGLDIQPNDIVLDGTIGFAGHSNEILKRLSGGQLIGLDRDPDALAYCQQHCVSTQNSAVHLFPINYADFPKALEELKINKVNKMFLDIGISSYQLDSLDRGFSYQHDAPLDMRMNPKSKLTARQILKFYSKEDLTRIFTEYGELRNCHKFVDHCLALQSKSSLNTTFELIELIKKSFFFKNKRFLFIKTCAQVFQSLRIEVNQELEQLKTFLSLIEDHLEVDGIVGIITFHSLEDRMVKQFVKDKRGVFKKMTKHVIQATQQEIRNNSRAKSAKLRLFRKLPDQA
jgi:16S rRNA (cytosine1402-N4)-methyltransferase